MQNLMKSTILIYEDRDIRLGEKLNIFDLIGIPIQIIVGEKNITSNNVEIKDRKTGQLKIISKDMIKEYLKKKL